MHTLLHIAVLTGTILLLARLLPGVHVRSIPAAVITAVVFSGLNFLLGWVIRAALFVPALLTLGLLFLVMGFIVNTVILWITDKVLHPFEIKNGKTLLIAAAIITVVNSVFHVVVG